jgi:hypothetical protein
MENYYKILGLKLGATLDEVEEKYKELLKEFDPEKQSEDLKEFFSVECNKVKEAYKEISLSLINSDNVEQVVDEINSVTSEIDSENEDLVTSPIEELIDESQENKESNFSISSEIKLKLTRAYLIMFILGLPLFFLILDGPPGSFKVILAAYYDIPLVALVFHFIGTILVLLCHMFLIVKSSGFLSIRENLAAYFIERKKYFIRILVFTPLVLFSLYGWGGMINYSEDKDYWYNRYNEIKSEVSGDDYDSGCNEGRQLKVHNQSNQDLQFRISYKKSNGEWSPYGDWSISSRKYTGCYYSEDGDMDYVTDYKYYIQNDDYDPYLYSKDVPHITNTCNAKCINIY